MRTETRKRRWPKLTRRQTLTAAASATLGAAALAVPGLSAAGDGDKGAAAGPDETIIVHLRDARNGTMDVFVGESRLQVRDKGLADRLRKAARR
ncbi:hypothetical protein Vqi01_21090 [Micromonospora qiuiae]|uniref:Secreted protein n=1 Tax=Micromonospora qiuiae TaxID=502268 RepID=A0ABQ4J9V3_9ACTN|nr:hypothetical protein [Micromonospora qiuiae]GIJ26947.1 hypothetical protein Vqi01_21090 [Micromonospora qiuiae]